MRCLALLLALAACERALSEDDRLVHEGAEEHAALMLRLAPPPPPPPPVPRDLPAPDEIVAFVRAHAADPGAWQVTLFELPGGTRPPLFMGEHVRRKRALGRAASVQVIAKLLQPIFTDGECACWFAVSLGIRLQRGSATLDLVYNAAHLMFTPEGHDGRYVVLRDVLWLHELRDRVGL